MIEVRIGNNTTPVRHSIDTAKAIVRRQLLNQHVLIEQLTTQNIVVIKSVFGGIGSTHISYSGGTEEEMQALVDTVLITVLEHICTQTGSEDLIGAFRSRAAFLEPIDQTEAELVDSEEG